MQVKGIKRGQTIELTQALNIPDGIDLLLEIDDHQFIGIGKVSFATPEEADRFIREERDRWDD